MVEQNPETKPDSAVSDMAGAALKGAATGGAHGAAAGVAKSFFKTKAGKVLIAVMAAVLMIIGSYVSALVTGAVAIISDLPALIAEEARIQLREFLSRQLSRIADPDKAVDDYAEHADDAPWAALYAIEEDAAAHPATGPYGVDPVQALAAFGFDCDLPDDAGWLDHAAATKRMACVFATAMRREDPTFTAANVLDGVEEYLDKDGAPAWRVTPDDPAGEHAKEVFTAAFAHLPLPGASGRADRLFDTMIRAALGILKSCGTPPTASGMGVAGTWVNPTQGQITSAYGPRTHPVTGQAESFHSGTDIGAPQGAPIRAAAQGTVIFAGWSGGYGGLTVIDHGGGVHTAYGHQDPVNMTAHAGDQVSAGQVIGLVDTTGTSTGYHLHFEVRVNGSTTDPVPFMADRGVVVGSDQPGPAPSGDGSFAAADADGKTWVLDIPAQISNARVIVDTGRRMGAPDTVLVAALGTAMIESRLRNLANASDGVSENYPNDGVASGDLDSIGVFQQRPSQGWGTVEQIMGSVEYQAEQFFVRAIPLSRDHPDWTAGRISVAVQRPSELYEFRYNIIVPVAKALLGAINGTMTGLDPVCSASSTRAGVDGQKIADTARALASMGGAYVWGGGHRDLADLQARIAAGFADDMGVDCSGFVRAVLWQATGVDTGNWAVDPRRDAARALFTEVPEADIQPGDVVHTSTHTAVVVAVNRAAGTYETAESADEQTGQVVRTHERGYADNGVWRYTSTEGAL